MASIARSIRKLLEKHAPPPIGSRGRESPSVVPLNATNRKTKVVPVSKKPKKHNSDTRVGGNKKKTRSGKKSRRFRKSKKIVRRKKMKKSRKRRKTKHLRK